MADNIAITAGSGTSVATDQLAGGEHVQYVKLMDGALDSSAKIGGDATNGLDVDVTRLPALPAGTNNIGDVDVLTLPAPFGAAGAASVAKAEDAASADADVGIPAMAVRKATPANTSGTDGDYEMLQISAGRLWTSATIDAALPAGTNAIGKLAANDGVDVGDVTINNASIAVTDNAGSLTVDAPVGTPVYAALTPGTGGGWTMWSTPNNNSNTALTTTVVAVKASAGTLGGYVISNPNTTMAYVQFFNVAAASVTLGTTRPNMMIGIPAQSTAHIEYTAGIKFGTAISIAASTTASGNTAPTTALDVTVLYN